jgi:hypothetical protein
MCYFVLNCYNSFENLFFTLEMLRHILFSICLILVFASFSAAQETCVLTAENAPSLFNLKLGNTPEQAQEILNRKFKIKNKTKGEYTFFQNYIKKDSPAVINGIRAFYLRFYDGKLYQIEFFYDEQNRFKSLEDFVNFQTSNLNLPPLLWRIEYNIAKIDCGGFSIQADSALNPRIEITDEAIRAEVEVERADNN